ncbi:hypothetical protein GF373_02675 [bacterium]|nr:hypothetical protein [bacterium]
MKKPRKTHLTIHPFLFECVAFGLLLCFCIQTWVTFSGKPGVDFRYYYDAALSIRNHGSPYWDVANYIYPPPLSILMLPLSYLRPSEGYLLWAILLCLAYGYTVFRCGCVGRCSRE